MTDEEPTGPLSAPPTAPEFIGESLTWMNEALDGLTTQIAEGLKPDGATAITVYAVLAQTHAMLAAATNLGRIADWLEGIELVDPSEQAAEEHDGDYHGICAMCGHPVTRRGNAFWTHDDPRRNQSLGGGHKAEPIPESVG